MSSSKPSQPNLGRRKVNIQKIENDRNLQVTFSKRRVGLFKKASELCTLTGTEAGIVVFSPGNKPHSFGHPNINAISERFLQQQSSNDDSRSHHHGAGGMINNNPRSDDVEYLAELERRIEGEKARREDLKRWAPSAAALGRLSHQQLAVLRGRIAEFGKALEARVEANGTELGLGMPYDGSMPIPYDDVAMGDGEACVVFYHSQG